MQDELSGFKPLDPGRVNTMDPTELRYWCRELHCSEDALMKAVSQVGDHVAEVREQLHTPLSGGSGARR